MPTLTLHDAVGAALAEEMRRDSTVIAFGEGIATKRRELAEEFGTRRIRNTPLSEGIIAGTAAGAAAGGLRPVADLLFALHTRDNTTLFLVTHEESLARRCQRIVRLKDGRPLVTDNGQHILDVTGLQIHDPLGFESEVNQWPGVVTVGVFAHQKAAVCLLGTAQGVQTLTY